MSLQSEAWGRFETTEEVHFSYIEVCMNTLAYTLTLNVRQCIMHTIKAILNILSGPRMVLLPC